MDHPPEEVPGHLVRGEPTLAAERAGDPVLVLEAEDPAVHDVSVGAASLVPRQPGAREGRPPIQVGRMPAMSWSVSRRNFRRPRVRSRTAASTLMASTGRSSTSDSALTAM